MISEQKPSAMQITLCYLITAQRGKLIEGLNTLLGFHCLYGVKALISLADNGKSD